MKCVLPVVFFIVVAKANLLSPEDKAKFKAIHEACMKESGVDKSVLANVIKTKELPEDDKLKKQVGCVTVKLNVVEEDGKIAEETLKYLINTRVEKYVKMVIKNCGVSKSSVEETAWALAKCLHKFVPQQDDMDTLALNFIASS